MMNLHAASAEAKHKRNSIRALLSALGNNVKFGVFLGLFVAVAFAVLSTISGLAGLSLGRKSANPFASLQMTYLAGLVCHLVAGVVGGAIAGVMRPLGRWLIGAMLIGSVAGAITAITFMVGEYGRHVWNPETREIIVLFACIGAIIAAYARSKMRSGRRMGSGASQ
jgi:purine-cytosine permease-like protein